MSEILTPESAVGSMSFELNEHQKMITETVRNFTARSLTPDVVMGYDESQKMPMDICKQLGELGLLGIIFPESLGGAGYGQ
jgi:alkylation response protein AidB-like acyl-CoA dehydrogenase